MQHFPSVHGVKQMTQGGNELNLKFKKWVRISSVTYQGVIFSWNWNRQLRIFFLQRHKMVYKKMTRS